MFTNLAKREGQASESHLQPVPRIRSSVLRVPTGMLKSPKDAGELLEHGEAEKRRPGLHQGRTADEESPQTDSESFNQAHPEFMQHRYINTNQTSQEERSSVTKSTRLSQQYNAGCWHSGKFRDRCSTNSKILSIDFSCRPTMKRPKTIFHSRKTFSHNRRCSQFLSTL